MTFFSSRSVLAVSFFYLLSTCLPAQPEGLAHLEGEIARLEPLSGGLVGVGIWHLESDEQLVFRPGQTFPMASSYKIPVAVQLLRRVEAGELRLDSMVTLTAADIHPGSGTISRLLDDPGVALSALNLLELMMLISDNSATDVCIRLAGGPEAINAMMRQNGIEGLSVDRPTLALIANYIGLDWAPGKNSSMPEFRKAAEALNEADSEMAKSGFSKDPRDQSTPGAMALLLAKIWKGELLNSEHTELLLDVMYRCETGNNRLKGVLPPGTRVAHKTGTIGGTTNDVGIIDLPMGRGHVIVAAFVRDSEIEVERREEVIAHIARAAYDYFLFR